jgi:glucose uptake protein GlcU
MSYDVGGLGLAGDKKSGKRKMYMYVGIVVVVIVVIALLVKFVVYR